MSCYFSMASLMPLTCFRITFLVPGGNDAPRVGVNLVDPRGESLGQPPRIGEHDGRTVRLDQVDDALLDAAGHDLRRRTACDTRVVSGRQFHTAVLVSEIPQLAGARPIQAGIASYSAVLETGVVTPVRSSIATDGHLRGEVRRDETLCCQGPDAEARSERAEHR